MAIYLEPTIFLSGAAVEPTAPPCLQDNPFPCLQDKPPPYLRDKPSYTRGEGVNEIGACTRGATVALAALTRDTASDVARISLLARIALKSLRSKLSPWCLGAALHEFESTLHREAALAACPRATVGLLSVDNAASARRSARRGAWRGARASTGLLSVGNAAGTRRGAWRGVR